MADLNDDIVPASGGDTRGFQVDHELLGVLVAETQDYAILLLDEKGNIASWNAGAERIKGYQPQEIIGQHFSVFYPPQDVAAGKPEHELKIARAEGRLEDEGWRVRKDGGRFWANVVIRALRDHDGVLRGYGKVTRDLTERRAHELQLAVSEERFRRSFDDALIGMMIFDLRGCYMRVNDAFCAIVGHPRETLEGLSRERITHPDDLAADAEALRALLAGEMGSYTREKRYIHATGQLVWVTINVTLINDPDGEPQHFIGQAQDITERRRHESQLTALADHDPLTGLLNRRSFTRELQSHLARVKRFEITGAVLLIDLDNFKSYNDTLGHNAGDELIVRIAHGLRDRLRETDSIARLGGDEFAVLLPRESQQSATLVARALLEQVRRENPAAALGDRTRITASVGIACFAGGEPLTPDEIIGQADLAMYDVKHGGRDGIAAFRPEQHRRPRTESQTNWADEISQALAHDRFELHAQPVRPLHAENPTHYELLLRMRDPHGELIPPSTFLYIAERLGRMQEIDRWVTDRAITMLAEHRAALRPLRLEVNLSSYTIGDAELLKLIATRLAQTGVPADRLIFEITETAVVTNIARAAAFAERLSELGCKFALDDFGAGFGSFYYLKHLPFDYLKIDVEFVRHCAESEIDRTLISAVVQTAHGLGKHTIAEFVENQATVDVLTRLGIDYGQGFHLGHPQPLARQLGAG